MDDSWRARGKSRGRRIYKPRAPFARKSSNPLGSRHRLPQAGPNLLARSNAAFTLCSARGPDQGQEVVTFERGDHQGSDRGDRRRPRPAEEERQIAEAIPRTQRPRRSPVGQRHEGFPPPDDVVTVARLPRQEDRHAASEALRLQPSGDSLELLTVQSLEERKRGERLPPPPGRPYARHHPVAALH